MIGSYAQLTKDHYPFLKGTQFKIESEDDGMYSLNDFFSGPTKTGGIVTCPWNKCEYIEDREYTGAELIDDYFSSPENQKEEQWWEYTKYC